MGKIKSKLTTLPRIFVHVVCRFNSITHPQSSWVSGVFFGSRDSDSASCPYRRSPLLLRLRKLPLYTDA